LHIIFLLQRPLLQIVGVSLFYIWSHSPTGESDGSSPSIIDVEWSLCIEKNGRHKNTCRRKKEKRCTHATPLEASKEAGDHKFITMPLCCAMPCAKKSYGKKHACTCNTYIVNKDPDQVNSSMVMSPGMTTEAGK